MLLRWLTACLPIEHKAYAHHLAETRLVRLQSEAYVKKVAEKLPDLGQRFIYMINTGNVISRGGLDLSQSTGFTVVAEKLNFHRQALPAILLCLSCISGAYVVGHLQRSPAWQATAAPEIASGLVVAQSKLKGMHLTVVCCA